MRVRTFRHIHDLSMLHQQSERRGSLVSRVTSDVDQITQFLQWGGVILLVVSVGQLVVTTVVMVVYSWQLTLVVYARVPAGWSSCIRASSGGWPGRTGRCGSGSATMLGAVAESVVGAAGDPGVRGGRTAPRPGSTTRSTGTGGPSSGRCAPA